MRNVYVIFLCVTILIISGMQSMYAQLNERLFSTDYQIDSLSKGDLSVEVDNLSFFKNNEFISTIQKGYTLPGFWLQVKATYNPLSILKLEAGVHSIWFWGTSRYPAFAYKDIASWGGQDFSHNVHVLPYFRANISLSKNVNVIIGDIYGGSNHRLIEPLYNPELNLTSDPEAGLQLLYKNSWLDFDTWIDWMTYIYNLDTHQEAFIAGTSMRFKLNAPDSRFHVYFPLQWLSHHKGGEIEVSNSPGQTATNYAGGTGAMWNIDGRYLKYINAEFYYAGYYYPKGESFRHRNGRGFYSKLAVQISDFNISSSYWACKDFVSIFGSPFYSTVSTKINGMLYDRPTMLHFGVDYVRTLGKGFTFGVNVETYYSLSGKMYSSETGLYDPSAFGSNSNFSMGIYLRVNPSFLIKKY